MREKETTGCPLSLSPLPFFSYLVPVITERKVCVDDRNDRRAELPRTQQR
jgi:hypothetical protein